MKTRGASGVAAVVLLAACGGDPAVVPTSDAATTADVGAPSAAPDRINVNCTGDANADEALASCTARLAARFAGATVFVGPRAACDGDLFGAACRASCAPGAIGAGNCGFTAGGCPIDASMGYAVVVDVGGRRAIASVGSSGDCPSIDGVRGRALWARVAFDDLVTAAMTVRRPPTVDAGAATDGGGATTDSGTTTAADRFRPCARAGATCGLPGDSCTQLASGALLCTRACANSEECGAGTVCRNFCYRACGDGGSACPMGTTCDAMGRCAPVP